MIHGAVSIGRRALVTGVLIVAPASHHAIRDGGDNCRCLHVGLLLDGRTFPIVNVLAMFPKCGETENNVVSMPLSR